MGEEAPGYGAPEAGAQPDSRWAVPPPPPPAPDWDEWAQAWRDREDGYDYRDEDEYRDDYDQQDGYEYETQEPTVSFPPVRRRRPPRRSSGRAVAAVAVVLVAAAGIGIGFAVSSSGGSGSPIVAGAGKRVSEAPSSPASSAPVSTLPAPTTVQTVPATTTTIAPPPGTPVITSLTPASAAAGQQITLTGTDLFSASRKIAVTFGTTLATVSCPSVTTCVATVPPQPAAVPAVGVTIATDTGTSRPVPFTYAP